LKSFEQLPFDSHQQGRLVIDRVVRNYLIHATHAAAADLQLTIHDLMARRGPVRVAASRRFPSPWSVA
jgi:hypothetical protein